MTKARLMFILECCRLAIDVERITTGTETAGFRTFECGVGAPTCNLVFARNQIIADWGPHTTELVKILPVTNATHPEFGKWYLLVESFWVAEESGGTP